MNNLDQKVKHHLSMINDLVIARRVRREMKLPVLDLNMRLWWHSYKLKTREAVLNG